MDLGLTLGHTSRPFRFMEKPHEDSNQLGLSFNTTLSIGPLVTKQIDQHHEQEEIPIPNQKHIDNSHNHYTIEEDHHDEATSELSSLVSSSPKDTNNTVLQLDLLPLTPADAPLNPPFNFFSWDPLLENEGRSSRGLEVNKVVPAAVVTVAMTAVEEVVVSPSSNSAAATFQMDLCMFSRGRSMSGEDVDERQMGCCRGSDEDENSGSGSTRKKLRLSKEQSAFLEESFKEHNTLSPLKQKEMDCEYLKKCCETLREENRRLQKELQELRVLKTLDPFCMHMPATTLTMCPSCERMATNSNTTTSPSSTVVTAKTIHHEPVTSKVIEFQIGRPKFYDPHPQKSHQPTTLKNLE
ncbi:hypothetical protein VNO78_06758 [Psophocarpus tetragonolobus]|uniref:Leucine zipper homeobox-associated domain-containing protein n=1 Tax=Psophocarpus tetragonolobus TaxID=3891 RepID=A0AAN9T207_PSOTE